MTSHRPLHIATLIRSTVAQLATSIPPTIASVVTVTDVRVSADLSYVDIDITAISGIEQAIQYLQQKKGMLRSSLSQKLSLYRLPALRFHRDTNTDRANRIDELFQAIDSPAKKTSSK